MTRLVFRPPAKVNIGLAVTGLTANKYHTLSTVFCSVSLRDRLVISPGKNFSVEVRGARISGKNLLNLAGQILMDKEGARLGVRLLLTKNIPIGGGLGGGSSDAACALRGLALYWGIKPRANELREWAVSLGADVPYFLAGGLARGHGLGDRIRRLPNPKKSLWFVLALDSKSLETKKVFQVFDRLGPKAKDLREPREYIAVNLAGTRKAARFSLQNDLWPAALYLRPSLGRKRALLSKIWDRPVALSGSGPTLYSVFGSQSEAQQAARTGLRQGINGLRVVQSLTREESMQFVSNKEGFGIK